MAAGPWTPPLLLSPSAAQPRTPNCFREDSGFLLQGRWVDASGSFYSGSVIEITEESWCPLDVKEAVHTSATYSHKILSCRRAELFEQRTNGVQKKFRATVGPNQTLFVELPINNLQWTLVRDSARSISWPSGLRLSFDDAEDELRHTAEANQRNRLPTLATSALLMAAALGEVVRRGRTTSLDSLLVVAAMAVGLGAWHVNWVYGDTLTICGAAATSVLLEVFQEEGGAIEHNLSKDGITLLLCCLFTVLTHLSGMEVRSRWSWLVPTVQVVCFIGSGLLYDDSRRRVLTDIKQVYCAILLGTVGMLCWLQRWHHEREERRCWAQQVMLEKRTMEQERAHDRIKSVMEAQAQLEELSKASPKRKPVRLTSVDGPGLTMRTEKPQRFKPLSMSKFMSEPPMRTEAQTRPSTWSLGDSKSLQSLQCLRTARSQHTAAVAAVVSNVGVPSSCDGVRSLALSQITSAGSPPSRQEQRPLQVPLPRELQLGKISAENAPNKLLAAAMAGQTGSLAKVRGIAEQIRRPAYSLRQFFEDCLCAFPELGLFFVSDTDTAASSGISAEVEYQRTIGALFAVFWLLRLDVAGDDGKEGFCFGVDASWRTLRGSGEDALGCAGKTSSELTEQQKRQVFYQTMDWAKFREVVTDALSCPTGSEVDRITAMLTLTSFHDIMKVQCLCPTVQEQHAPYQGYEAGSLIFDHDIALAYVLEHHGWMLPSFHVLPREAQAAVLFSQAKMQFNHGWFVQAEAPPGAMLSGFKRVAGTAARGDIAFYFFHWLTDLAGAEGTPLAGADKFAVKFPPKVLNAFLWSMRFLHRLQDSTETAVVEEYLRARWHTALPDEAAPSGPDAVALMRLATMSGTCGQTAVRAFRSLDAETMHNLSSEMALTGLADQRYQYPSSRSAGGPAFLVYYGPAVLQRCEDDHKQMRLALYAVSAVYRAGRLLWPFRSDMKHLTVTLEIGQLKSLSIGRVFLGGAEESRKVWVLIRQGDKEASCKLLGPREVNSLMAKQIRFALLELEEEGEEKVVPDAPNAEADEEDVEDDAAEARTDVRGSIASVATPSRGGRRDGAGGGSDNKARGPANGLEDLMRRKGVDEAWTALEEMQNQGTSTDKYTVSRMLMKTVGDGRCKINPTRVYRGISLVERFIDTQPKDVDEVLFNALLDTCCRLKDLNRLESTLARMRELNVSPSPVTLGILVKTYGQAGDLQKVLQVWREMEKQRGQANAVTYGCMIDACVKCGHLEKAVEIFKGMRETGKHRNTILYTTLIKGYGLEKDLPSALELFREMPQEGVAYNTITFNSILDACIKCGDLAQAEGLLREMTQSDSSVEPDLITFSTLLKGYCHIGDLDKALQVAESIKARGLNCDELVYNTLMDGCVKANDLAAGIGLFEEMMQSGLRPSAITHSILARLYQRAGYDDAPGSIAQLYQQHGIERPSGGDRGRTGMGPRGNRRARSPSGSTRAGDFSGSGTPLGSPLGSPSGASLRSESLNPFVFEGFDCISAGNSAPATPLNGSPAASPAHRGGAGLFLPPDALRGGCVPPLPGADPCASAVAARWPSVDQSPGANMAAMSPFGAAGGCSFAQAQQALPPFPFQPCGPPAGDAGAQQMQQMIAMPVGSPVGAAGTPAGFGALSEPPHSALSPTSAQPMGTPTGMLQAQHPSFMMPMPGPGDGHFAVQGHAQQAYFDTWGRQQAPQHAPQQLPQMPPQEQQALQEHHMQHMQHQFMQQQMQQQMQQHQMHLQQVQQVQQMMQPAHMGGCVGHGASFEPGRPS